MALTYTPEPELGSKCPDFSLPVVTGGNLSLKDLKNFRALAVMFICNHCPYVKAIEDRILTLARDMKTKGVEFVAISSNDSQKYPDDSPQALKARALEKNYPFPYLFDETQEVARTFGAVCTPDFFVYDANLRLAYRGRLDDSWKDASQVKSQEMRGALEALVAGGTPSPVQKPSMGCNIKWKQ
jgi:peroxiredoxin